MQRGVERGRENEENEEERPAAARESGGNEKNRPPPPPSKRARRRSREADENSAPPKQGAGGLFSPPARSELRRASYGEPMRRGSGARGSTRGGRGSRRRGRKNQHHAIAPLSLSLRSLLSVGGKRSGRGGKEIKALSAVGYRGACSESAAASIWPGRPCGARKEAERERGKRGAAQGARSQKPARGASMN